MNDSLLQHLFWSQHFRLFQKLKNRKPDSYFSAKNILDVSEKECRFSRIQLARIEMALFSCPSFIRKEAA